MFLKNVLTSNKKLLVNVVNYQLIQTLNPKLTITQLSRNYTSEINKDLIDSIVRVDHAGEFGADRIYAGQLAILEKTDVGPKIKEMWEQEKGHRAKFEEFIRKYRVRPTAFLPIWDVAGFVLGAGTALLGTKGAMACTVAVESVIVDHYNDQLRKLLADENVDKELVHTIKQFRDEEQEHHDTGIEYGALEAPFYEMLTGAIKVGCKAAIELSKVV